MTTDYYHRPIAFSGIDGDENMGRLVGNSQFSHRTKHAENLHKPSHLQAVAPGTRKRIQ